MLATNISDYFIFSAPATGLGVEGVPENRVQREYLDVKGWRNRSLEKTEDLHQILLE